MIKKVFLKWYTEGGSKVGILTRRLLKIFRLERGTIAYGQGMSEDKILMQSGTPQKPIFESRSVYLQVFLFLIISAHLQGIEVDDAKEQKVNKCETKEEDKSEDKDKDKEEEEPPKIGNFALATSQQPYGLFAFGGNVIDKGEVQLFLFADDFEGKRKVIIDLIPSALFGITDEWSIFFNFPYAPKLKDGCQTSSGLEDIFIQMEFAFYNKKTATYVDQATVVGNVTTPTGSIRKMPPTGFGSPSFFIGGTYCRMMVDWFVFAGQGAILTTSDHRTKIGDQFLYQFGFGRNIPSPPDRIYAWMIEIDGQYNQKSRVHGKIDPNSGGNAIFVTPSIWISTKNFLFQFGVGFPVNQNLFGRQNKFDYVLNLNVAWSFY